MSIQTRRWNPKNQLITSKLETPSCLICLLRFIRRILRTKRRRTDSKKVKSKIKVVKITPQMIVRHEPNSFRRSSTTLTSPTRVSSSAKVWMISNWKSYRRRPMKTRKMRPVNSRNVSFWLRTNLEFTTNKSSRKKNLSERKWSMHVRKSLKRTITKRSLRSMRLWWDWVQNSKSLNNRKLSKTWTILKWRSRKSAVRFNTVRKCNSGTSSLENTWVLTLSKWVMTMELWRWVCKTCHRVAGSE